MIDYSLFKRIEDYAIQHAESSKKMYQQRNQNLQNIITNCLRGKIAEYCCYYSMTDGGYILESEPDLEIYEEYNKSYDADLICTGKGDLVYTNKRHIHVKSISRDTYNKYGASILMEGNDPIVNKPDENHYLSIMLQNSLSDYSFYRWVNSVDCEWKDPILNLPTKKALYFT